jgi:cytochrome P450
MERKYDLYSQAFHRDSHRVFAHMRQDDPVIQQAGLFGENDLIWFVTRYADIEYVLLHDGIFVRDPSLAMPATEAAMYMSNIDPRVNAMLDTHMLNKEGEDHRRLRALVSTAFTPRVIHAMRPRIQQIADELLDRVAGRGTMELVSEYAYPLPLTVIAELLGIPQEDRPRFRAWSNAVVEPALTPEAQHEGMRLLQEMGGYMAQLIAERRQRPGPDLLSGLIHAEEAGDRLSQDELFSMLMLLVVAGHETTVTFIGNAVLSLLENPSELAKLKQNPDLMPAAVEELLRYDSPVERALTRWVAQDVELGGCQLRRGEMVIVILSSANRDETRFTDPTKLELERQPNAHIAFGKGIHYCLGAPLARLEGEIALRTLFGRFPDLQLACAPAELSWRDVPLFHSLQALPLRWTVE